MSVVTRRIVIVGGGTAGWLTAAILAKQHGKALDICLIESSDIPPIGVGEGTWPSMRLTLERIGISETDFIRNCSATFKQASRFVNWIDTGNEEYFHPFTQPIGYGKFDISPYWQSMFKSQFSFSDAVTFQSSLCRKGIAPKTIAHKEYETLANYGYHLDAGKFATLLKDHSIKKLGVKHIVANVVSVQQTPSGDIESVTTDDQQVIKGELFIDCSGFSSLLIGKTLGVPFESKQHILFADSALAMQVPYSDPETPIACHTISTAQEAGWIWDIGLQQRRGVGYVYSSQYSSDEQAEKKLRKYVGEQSNDLAIRKISFESGHRREFWKNNCVAIGLSAGFLEPLEASALMLVETSANFVADQLPLTSDHMSAVSRRFNHVFLNKWRGVIDFLKLHYALSNRSEPFWQANKEVNSQPDSLLELIALWKFRSPSEYDLVQSFEAFNAASYQYVLYGAGFNTDFSLTAHTLNQSERANKQFVMNQKQAEQLEFRLPRHRELIDQIIARGFATI